MEACTALYVVLWTIEKFDEEDWFVITPEGEILMECNFPYEHDDGEIYCLAEDVEWIPEHERISIAAQLGNIAPPLPSHIEFWDGEGL
ncbi:hypothetical protein JJL56_01620 [Azospirillum sp. YIM DDC1]|uniref:Uncharacterized protein n=1 Tax=Azospirillum aestuarii TaxID=2802052 RepID=A0ABS1HSB0_9PROT|nr:hypothetical protein [Azospirillum aestuarii]MBK4717559.1 hypothetical protein [Azospirillum aestuarii]